MRFKQYYSSSHGNLYAVSTGKGERLLLECGVSWNKLKKALDFDLSGIDACFVTHEHQDHCKAAKDVMSAGIDIYASVGTLKALGVMNNRKAKIVPPYSGITNSHFDCFAFPIIHDAKEPLGLIVRETATNEYLLFCPDSAYIKQRFSIPFDIIAIECSYDKDVLRRLVDNETINETLAKRLLTSHMEKRVTIKYIAESCDLSRCREIHLLHMSGDNIEKTSTKKEFEDRFYIETIIV